jgi:hypothetical protein
MRTLCLVLILANVLYFTWSQMIDVHGSSLDRRGEKPVEAPARIVLAREMLDANPDERSVGPVQDVQPPAVEPLDAQTPPLTRARLRISIVCRARASAPSPI